MSPKPAGKQEFLVLNIGAGVQVGGSVTVVGVVESQSAAMALIRKMGATSVGKLVIAEKKTIVTRNPVVELTESHDTILANSK